MSHKFILEQENYQGYKGYYLTIKWSINQDDATILNVYVP